MINFMSSINKKLNFEQSMQALDDIVARLETGALSLEESLSAFAEGVQLTRECQQHLDEAEQKVTELLSVDEKISPDVLSDENEQK